MSNTKVQVKYGSNAKMANGSVGFGAHNVTTTVTTPLPDLQGQKLKLKVVATDATVTKGGLKGLTATVDVSGKGSITYNAESKLFKGEVTTKTSVKDKDLSLKLAHDMKGPSTSLDSTYSLSKDTKLNAKYCFNNNGVALKATHTLNSDWTVEPTFDVSSKAWSVTGSTKVQKKALKLKFDSANKATVEYNITPAKLTLTAPVKDIKATSLGW
eukprot:CAMPEP_0197848006 /NCGR_PEP_ID=MMETSP1438-20131217/7746_1 /TAXON_ID=1461541 /ORGANISM="Pterosperma sp., Strain CCMP1384" /LENGTH=212 /DNA_ID=CAMNT_0043460113 /DNA_START=84 /DNA_END=719 /DNA_ORIENTATION=+